MYYKILTHDFRSPLQGGKPLFDGKTFPFTLPTAVLDTSGEECAAGWNFCESLAEGFKIAGLWPDGRPSTVFIVTPSEDVILRGAKSRSSGLTLLRPATAEEIENGIKGFSQHFTPWRDEMVAEQLAWREALARPLLDGAEIEKNLQRALTARGLAWRLKKFDSARAARAARDAWDARAARAAWDAWAAWDARAAWAARDARAAWAAWDAWDARDARDAWDALSVFFASKQNWIKNDPYMLTTGLRDAYKNGLEIAVPTGPNELGWTWA